MARGDHTVLPATHAFIHEWKQPYLPLLSEPQLVLIYRLRKNGQLSWLRHTTVSKQSAQDRYTGRKSQLLAAHWATGSVKVVAIEVWMDCDISRCCPVPRTFRLQPGKSAGWDFPGVRVTVSSWVKVVGFLVGGNSVVLRSKAVALVSRLRVLVSAPRLWGLMDELNSITSIPSCGRGGAARDGRRSSNNSL